MFIKSFALPFNLALWTILRYIYNVGSCPTFDLMDTHTPFLNSRLGIKCADMIATCDQRLTVSPQKSGVCLQKQLSQYGVAWFFILQSCKLEWKKPKKILSDLETSILIPFLADECKQTQDIWWGIVIHCLLLIMSNWIWSEHSI